MIASFPLRPNVRARGSRYATVRYIRRLKRRGGSPPGAPVDGKPASRVAGQPALIGCWVSLSSG